MLFSKKEVLEYLFHSPIERTAKFGEMADISENACRAGLQGLPGWSWNRKVLFRREKFPRAKFSKTSELSVTDKRKMKMIC